MGLSVIKTVEVRIMQFSPQSSPVVLRDKFQPEILTCSTWERASNNGNVKTSCFLDLCVKSRKRYKIRPK